METNQVERAIALLQNTQEQLHQLLEPLPNLQIQGNHVLTALLYGLAFAIKRTDLVDKQTTDFTVTPLIFPENEQQKIPSSTVISSDMTYTEEELEALRTKATTLYKTFCNRATKDIIEALSIVEIQAVAKLAGIDPTNHPQQIDHSFINIIKEAITKKEAEQKQMDEWLAKKEKEEASQPNPTEEAVLKTKSPTTGKSSKKTPTKK